MERAIEFRKQVTIPLDGIPTAVSYEQAILLFQQRASRKPEQAISLGLTLLEQTLVDKKFYYQMFALLTQQKQFATLETVALSALDNFNQDAISYYALSQAQRYLRKPEAQLKSLKHACKLSPTHMGWQLQLAICHKELGQFSVATALFNDCITKNHKVSECYYWRFAMYKVISEQEVQKLKDIVEHSNDNDEKSFAAFCLFDVFNLAGNQQRAWQYIILANTLKYSQLAKYRAKSHSQELKEHAAIPGSFNMELLVKSRSKAHAKCIFITGMPRSGTTLIEQILSSHQNVAAGDESFALAQASQRIVSSAGLMQAFPSWSQALSEKQWQEIGDLYLTLTENLRMNKPWLTDKMPLNYKAIGVIHMALPEAKIVHCKRHPMAILWGCFKQMLGDGNVFTYQLNELTDMIIAHHELMKYWKQVLPNKIHTVEYENLVSEQDCQTRALLTFVGLDWQQSCIDFHLNPRLVHTISNVQIRQPLFSTNVELWHAYKEQLMPYAQRFIDHGMLDESLNMT